MICALATALSRTSRRSPDLRLELTASRHNLFGMAANRSQYLVWCLLRKTDGGLANQHSEHNRQGHTRAVARAGARLQLHSYEMTLNTQSTA